MKSKPSLIVPDDATAVLADSEPLDLEYTVNPEALLTTSDVRFDRAEVARLRELVTELNEQLRIERAEIARLKSDVEQLLLIKAEFEAQVTS